MREDIWTSELLDSLLNLDFHPQIVPWCSSHFLPLKIIIIYKNTLNTQTHGYTDCGLFSFLIHFCSVVGFSSMPESTGMQRVRMTDFRDNLPSSLIFSENYHSHTWGLRLLVVENYSQWTSEKIEMCCYNLRPKVPRADLLSCSRHKDYCCLHMGDTVRHCSPIPNRKYSIK